MHASAAGSVLSSYEFATFKSRNFHLRFQVTAHICASVLSSYEFARAAAATSAFPSSPRTNSRVPLPRRLPRARPALTTSYESGDPRRASLPRTTNKKGDEINRPTPHYQAQLRAAKTRRRIFFNEFPLAGRDQPAVRRPPIERLPYSRQVFRRFRVTTACAPKLKKKTHFFTKNDLALYSAQLSKKSNEN